MKKAIKTIGWCLLALFVIYTFFFLWKQSQPAPVVYELVKPVKRDIVKKIVATGDLEARNQVELKPQVNGIVTDILVKPGEAVKVGDVVAVVSVILALIAIFIYILVRFRNVAYSVGSIFALGIDVLMIMGCYSLLHGLLPMSLELDQTFIGAILTAIGYSINDKVVIFDRIREFSQLYPKHDKLELFNNSLNTTLARTLNTSFSTLVVLLCIFVLGGDSIRSFSFAMILGVVFGTLSSLFIAAPVAYAMIAKQVKKAAK